jgi:hypothetical protein
MLFVWVVVTITMFAQVALNCLRYIFLQDMKFIWKVLLGLLLLFLFYFSRLYFAEPNFKELLDVYSVPDFEEVWLR